MSNVKIEKNIAIKLTEQNVKEIIADYLVREGYKVKADEVEFQISHVWKGYGLDERCEHCLTCAQVKYGEE